MAAQERFILDFVTRGVDGIDRAASKVEALSGKVNTLGTALLGVSFGAFVKGAFDAADRLADLSDATNISIASLESLGAAMQAAGGNSKNLERSINGFFAAIEQANSGSLAARDAFSKVGVSLEDLKNLSEADLLDKTLKGLAQLPVGAERSAIATQLLTKAFRSVDAQKLLEALDPEKYKANEEATKQAAETVAKLEKAYKELQIAALNALTPIAKLFGEVEFNSKAAEKIILAVGAAFALSFGAAVVANIIAIGRAIIALNAAMKTQAVLQAGIQALQGPKGWAILAGAAAAAGAAMYGLNKMLDDTDASSAAAEARLKDVGNAAAEAAKKVDAATPDPNKKVILPATPQTGVAGRNQELDARQKAIIESEKRIAASQAEIRKNGALAGADEIRRIEIESAAEIEKARIEIFGKENLSKTQQAKEFAAKEKEIQSKAAEQIATIRFNATKDSNKRILDLQANTAKEIASRTASELEKIEVERLNEIARVTREINDKIGLDAAKKAEELAANTADINERYATRTAQVRRQLENEVTQQKIGYQNTINGLLGKEQTEVEKVTQLIAQQPEKYKEIGQRMLENAGLQDKELEKTREILRLRDLERARYNMQIEAASAGLQLTTQVELQTKRALGYSDQALTYIQANLDYTRRKYELENNMEGAYEAQLLAQGKSAEMTRDQIAAAKKYNDLLPGRLKMLEDEYKAIQFLAQRQEELSADFLIGWEYAFNKFVEQTRNAGDQAKTIFSTLTKGFEDSIVKFVQTGKLSFKDLFNDLIAQATRIAANRLLMSIFGSFFGGSGAGFLGSLFGGFRADGGPVAAGKAYVVGEQGPEMFVPRVPGTIVPNQAAMAGGASVTNVNYNIQAVDASSFRALVARDPEFIFNVTEQGRRSLPTRSRR